MACVVLVAGALLLVAAPPTGAGAQTAADEVVANAASTPAVSAALTHVNSHRESTTAFHAEIAAIISASGQERDRARAVAARMRQIGLTSVMIDETPNGSASSRGDPTARWSSSRRSTIDGVHPGCRRGTRRVWVRAGAQPDLRRRRP